VKAVRTTEGALEYSAGQVRGASEAFVPRMLPVLSARMQELERLAVGICARGRPTRDIEDAFTDETGRRFLSRVAVAGAAERLWTRYAESWSRALDGARRC
jgi:hypothetical protein